MNWRETETALKMEADVTCGTCSAFQCPTKYIFTMKISLVRHNLTHPTNKQPNKQLHDEIMSETAEMNELTAVRSIVTTEDMRSLRSDWLTDNNITFWEEVLEHEVLNDYKGVKIVLLRPSMVMLLNQLEDKAAILQVLPDLSKATHIFLPLNDCDDPREIEGGSHWSLLVVGVRDKVAFHYDSLPPHNDTVASNVAKKVFRILGAPNGWRYLQLPDTPRQINGSDCGVHVCMTMQELLFRLLKVDINGNVNMLLRDVRQDAAEFRKHMERKVEEERLRQPVRTEQ